MRCGWLSPVVTLVLVVLTEWIARGSLTVDTLTQYILPHAEAYLLAWALLFLIWLTVDWLTRFAPLATLIAAILGCVPAAVDFYTLQLRGEPFLPWDLAQVSEAAGVASAAGIHIQTSMVVSIVLILLLIVASFFLYRGRKKLNWKPRALGVAASAAAICGLLFGVFLQPAVTQAIGILPDAWMQDRYYRYYGVTTSFLTNLTNLEISKPDDYSEDAVNEILDDTAAAGNYQTAPLYPASYGAVHACRGDRTEPHHHLCDGRVLLGCLGAGAVWLCIRHGCLRQPPSPAGDRALPAGPTAPASAAAPAMWSLRR